MYNGLHASLREMDSINRKQDCIGFRITNDKIIIYCKHS